MKLPTGGRPDTLPTKRDIRTVNITHDGKFVLGTSPVSLQVLEENLVKDYRANPNLVVYLRADEASRWKDVAAVLDVCQKHGITRVSPRTEPPKPR